MDITRGVPAALLAGISGPYFHPVVLMHVDWPGAPLWMHSNRGNITWESRTWLGVGKFGQVELPEEIAEGMPTDFSIALFSDFPDIEDHLDTVIRGARWALRNGPARSWPTPPRSQWAFWPMAGAAHQSAASWSRIGVTISGVRTCPMMGDARGRSFGGGLAIAAARGAAGH